MAPSIRCRQGAWSLQLSSATAWGSKVPVAEELRRKRPSRLLNCTVKHNDGLEGHSDTRQLRYFGPRANPKSTVCSNVLSFG